MSTEKKPESVKKSGEKCPMDYVFYVIAACIVALYAVYIYDAESFDSYADSSAALRPVAAFFRTVEKYSPFHEYIGDDNGEKTGEVILTKDELARYDGKEGSPGLYIAILGQIFDVGKSAKFYGPDGGYSCFAGRDASRAFVTGQFEGSGLTDDVEGLSDSDYTGLEEWLDFYHKDYVYVGKLAGRYFDGRTGQTTRYYRLLQDWLNKARKSLDENEAEKRIFPSCNSQWSAEKGQRVWCTKKSGGVDREWVGVPRRLFLPGKSERCACVKESGDSLYYGKSGDRGDLDYPHLKGYELCPDPRATSCQVTKPEADK